MKYEHLSVEKKWQEYWEKNQTFKTDVWDFSKPKFYALDMFPYPSGVGLHAGHPEGYLSQFKVRLFQFYHQPPFETGKYAVFHTLQHNWCAVGCKNQLLAVLVQVIEDMEKSLLCLGSTCQFLDIINNQDINALIELDEIVELVGSYRIRILYLEKVCRDV